jgi:deoxyribodipyrimidine photo-lyase
VNKIFNKSIVWIRRDIRLHDHAALHFALKRSKNVYCVFIFDTDILNDLKEKEDRRIDFIWESLKEVKLTLKKLGSDIIVRYGRPKDLIPEIVREKNCEALFFNKDYEKYAISRDDNLTNILSKEKIVVESFKDQVLYENREILTQSEKPYTVFSPYKNSHLKKLAHDGIPEYECNTNIDNFAKFQDQDILSIESMGFKKSDLNSLKIPTGTKGGEKLLLDFEKRIDRYKFLRDYPGKKGVSYLSVHNRFGTISIREQASIAIKKNTEGATVWLNELIWRDFYFQILSNFPHVCDGKSFKAPCDQLEFENNLAYFDAWKEGKTGFPIVDAAMQQINQTGFMHNRLRMIVASFLVKDLLIDWRWGEEYFAEKLIDYDFAANNGGWQWAASTGCDAQPWFRIFNPLLQSQKFDSEGLFIKKYLPSLQKLSNKEIHSPFEFYEKNPGSFPIKLGIDYPLPIVNHGEQRKKTLKIYERALK